MKHISSEKLAGILITVSIHLAVIIILLLTVVEPSIRKQSATYEFDFTKVVTKEVVFEVKACEYFYVFSEMPCRW